MRFIQSSFSEDNYCDDCEDIVKGIVQLQVSNKEEKKIVALSELVRDRNNKFLFVGEGNFSFTVAFNAYRRSLLSMDCSLLDVKDYHALR